MSLDSALSNAARGFRVFPASGKAPLIQDRWTLATTDSEQIIKWWTQFPDANPGVVCGPSNLTVVDVDTGLADEPSLVRWMDELGLPKTYAVQTGGDGFRVQLYYSGTRSTVHHDLKGCGGEIRSIGAHVMGARSIHPDTGREYRILWDLPIVPLPDAVRDYKPTKEKTVQTGVGAAFGLRTTWSLPVREGDDRSGYLMEQAGVLRHMGLGEDAIQAALYELNHNPERITVPKPDAVVNDIARRAAQFPLPEPEPVLMPLSKPGVRPSRPSGADWHLHYHTLNDFDNVRPPQFLIENVLQLQAILMIGAFVGQKKTLFVLNVVWSLLTGKPLFGKFEVVEKPARVLYLGPENGLISFADRVKRLGLREYIGKTFFFSTMSMENPPSLPDLTLAEIKDAVVVIDTLCRYTDGNENDSEAMKMASEMAFSLIRDGAKAVIVLHHSRKGSTKEGDITLENVSRGSGELVAFTSAVIGLRTQEPDRPYDSRTLAKFVKERDFETNPSAFEVMTDKQTCLMTFMDGSEGAKVVLLPHGPKMNRDGMQAAADALIIANWKLSHAKIAELLKSSGIERSDAWVGKAKKRLIKSGKVSLPGIEIAK